MQLYSGIDLHSNNCVIAIIGDNQQSVLNKRLSNDLGQIIQLFQPFKDALQGIVVESTYNWYWLVDGLLDAGFKVHLANTTAIQQYKGIKCTDDHTDAQWLAELLRLNILPEGYICPKDYRSVRDLSRKRLWLVQQRTRNILSLQTSITRQTGKRLSANQLKKITEADLQAISIDENIYLAVNAHKQLIDHITAQERIITKHILAQIQLQSGFKQLQTIPGIGKLLALTIMLETIDVHRFASVGQFSSYCRCVKSERISNGKKKGVNNSKNGNKYLSWAFIEAANFSIRFDPKIKAYYQRKCVKKCRTVAVKTVAHKLARASYYILKDGVNFDVMKAFG